MQTKKHTSPSPVHPPTKVPLDERDRAILRLVLADPRTSIADIAREVGAQRDTVLYRIERMERDGLITKYHTIIDPAALGLPTFMLLLVKLSPAHEAQRGTWVDKLANLPNVTHITRLIGPYDYFAQVATTDIVAFDGVLSTIKNLVPGAVADITTSAMIDGIKTDDFRALV